MANGSKSTRRGFALITVLWMVAALAILLLHTTQQARDAFNAARNRATLLRAKWRANACLNELQQEADAILSRANARTTVAQRWIDLDNQLARGIDSLRTSSDWPDCEISISAKGARLDINSANSTELLSLIRMRTGAERPDLVGTIQDWRDSDDSPTSGGAERDWYRSARRRTPKNQPFDATEELRDVRGFEDERLRNEITPYLGTDEGLVSLNNAPPSVLVTIPGITAEAAAFIVNERRNGRFVGNLNDLLGRLPPAAADTLLAHFAEAETHSAIEPKAWTVSLKAQAGNPALAGYVEATYGRSGRRIALLRYKVWP